MHWTNGAYEESWKFVVTTLSEMPTSVALPTSHHFHPSLSPVVSLSLGILHEWMRTQIRYDTRRYFNVRSKADISQLIYRTDASRAIFEPPAENWRRPPGRPRTIWMKNIHDELSSLDLGIHEARDLAQNRPLWRLMSLHSATHV